MCTLALHGHSPALRNLSGYVMMAPFLKISDHLKPPAPVLLIAKALSIVFPKCAFRVDLCLTLLCAVAPKHEDDIPQWAQDKYSYGISYACTFSSQFLDLVKLNCHENVSATAGSLHRHCVTKRHNGRPVDTSRN